MFRIIIVRTVSPLTSHRQLLIKRITPVLISASLNIREYEENKESTSHGPDLCLESSADTSTIVYRCQIGALPLKVRNLLSPSGNSPFFLLASRHLVVIIPVCNIGPEKIITNCIQVPF